MIIHSNLSRMKIKIILTSLQGNYRDSLGEFGNISYGIIRADKVKREKAVALSIIELHFHYSKL